VEYRQMGLLLLGGAVVAWAWAVWFLSRPLAQLPSYSQLLLRSGLSWAALLFMVVGLSSSFQMNDEPLNVTADLSLLSSWAERGAENGPISREDDEVVSGTVRPGPLREGEVVFESSLLRVDPRRRPNVILVMLESVGVNHLGYMGYGRSTTPELDSLASESLNFTSVRTTATHSNYAQMAVLSSLFPRRYAGLDTYKRLDYPRVLWHDVLSQIGYATATFSSQDERWQGMLRFEQTQVEHPIFHAANYTGRKTLIGSERTVPDEVTVRRAVAWLERQTGPFGLYLNFQSTHFPYVVPDNFPKPFLPDQPARGRFHYISYPAEDRPLAINRYDNALAYVDQQLGVLKRALLRLKLDQTTILIVTSDHGELFGEHDTVTHGRTLFEAEARVPLLIRYPSELRPRRDERSVSTLDVMPTLLGLLGIPPHPSYQGIDVLGAGYDTNRPILMNIQGMRSREGVICGEYKYTRSPTGRKPALFHLPSDPEESSNLMDQEPALATQLDRFLSAHMRAQMAYYRPGQTGTRSLRFAPRFGSCDEPAKRMRPSEYETATQ
jgi:arylsulfatase A-like enzyme